jgi:hypothetical protein
MRPLRIAAKYQRLGADRRYRVVVRLAAATFIAALAMALPASASADALLPPGGQVFAGVSGGYDTASFERETGQHPAVFQFFSAWGGSLEYMFRGAEQARSRLMIHLSTLRAGREVITPRGIATGQGDGYLVRLNRRIAEGGQPVYIRLMAEMDGNWNPYCAFDASGRSRGPAHSTTQFRRAWRRTVIVLRGGPAADVNARLRAEGMPPVDTTRDELPRANVAFLWVPQVAGSPDTAANSPRAYWPGARYVDWVGTDLYSKFPNFAGLERFYRQFPAKPFSFAEYAIWGRDDPGFVHRIFGWARSHRRVRMMLYNQGVKSAGPFRLVHYPRSRAALASELRSPRFARFAAEYRR